MSKVREKIKLTSYDELLKVETTDGLKEIDVDKLHDFSNHPFKVSDDEKMEELTESIRERGVLLPILVRKTNDEEYEIISGHRRTHAARLAGLEKVPVIIRELSDDDATIVMVDSNIQREEILPSEKAYAFQMKLEAIHHKGIKGAESREVVGEANGLSGRQVSRYIKLTNLLPELLEMVDEKKIAIKLAVEIAELSVNAKLLYGVLLDRMNLSMKNRWFDSENRVYIIYQIAEIMEDFNFSKKTAVRYLNELENFGLVEKKRRGLGLPSLLYVKNFVVFQDHSEPDDTDFDDVAEDDNLNEKMETSRGIQRETSRGVGTHTSRSVDMETSKGVQKETLRGVGTYTSRSGDVETSKSVRQVTSRGVKSELQEVTKRGPLISKTNSNNININNTKESNNILSNPMVKNAVDVMGREEESIFEKYTKMVKDNIDYDVLISRHYLEKSMIDGMVNLIVETIISENDYIIISSTKFPKEAVKSRFSKLDISHIEYVLECMNHNTTNIKNIKKYLLAALYNAPTTIDSYYKARVQHDMPELAN